MTSVLLAVRVVLTALFAIAGIAKLVDRDVTRETMAAFGVPRGRSAQAAVAVPVAELVIALALLITPTAQFAGLAGAGLLLIFTAGVVNALRGGEAPSCNCFGQVSSEPVSTRTVARNTAFVAAALFVGIAGPGGSISNWTTNVAASNLTAALAVIGLAGAGAAMVRATRQANAAIADAKSRSAQQGTGLSPGAPAPQFELLSVGGESVALSSLLERGRPVVLVFANPLCEPCNALIPQVSRWNSTLSERLTFAVVEGATEQPEALVETSAQAPGLLILAEPDQTVSSEYGVVATPTAVTLAPDGRIAYPPASGAFAIEQLVRASMRLSESQLAPAA